MSNLKEEIDSKCRLCHLHEEIVDHLNSGCPVLAKNEYVMRHDKVCAHLHYSICKALGVETKDQWYTNKHTHTHTSQCINRKMLQCCGIKRYTQTVFRRAVRKGTICNYTNSSYSAFLCGVNLVLGRRKVTVNVQP